MERLEGVCVRACVRACVFACLCMRVCVCVYVRIYVYLRSKYTPIGCASLRQRPPGARRQTISAFEPLILLRFVLNFPQTQNTKYHKRVSPPEARPLPRRSRQKVDFLHRESTPEAKEGEKGPRVGSLGRELA